MSKLNSSIAAAHFSNYEVFGNTYNRYFNEFRPELTYQITQKTEYRPDRISMEIYGTPIYDWVIMIHCGCHREMLKSGLYIVIPTLDTINRYNSLR